MKSALGLLLAGSAAVFPLLALALYGQYDYYHGESHVLANGSPDNDPIRASGAVLLLSPLFVLLFAVYFASVRSLLRSLWAETLAAYLTVGAVISALLAAAIVRDEFPSSFAGVATAFIVSFVLFFSCFALGTLAVRAARAG